MRLEFLGRRQPVGVKSDCISSAGSVGKRGDEVGLHGYHI